MRKFSTSLVKSLGVLLVSLLALNTAKAQIFFEDFEGGVMPAGWGVFDGDGQTPHPNVAQFTSAWIVAEDFDLAGDTVAMSTSWYQPLTGPSNDWLMTPSIALTANNEVRWQGEAQDASFPDGYQVRLSTGAQTPANTTNYSNLLLNVPAESGATRTTRSVNLQGAGFSNQNVHIAWVNNSLDMFILMIDNVTVRVSLPVDAELQSIADNEYTILPLAQASALPVNGVIKNNGTGALTNVTMTVNIYDGLFTQVYTNTSAGQNIAVSATANYTLPNFVPTAADFYTFEYIANVTGDLDRSNDTLYFGILVSDSTMARDDGNVGGSLGIGAGNGGVLGQIFKLNSSSSMSSVFAYHGPRIGQQYVMDVYNWNNTTHEPGTVIASTVPEVSAVDTFVFETYVFSSPVSITAGDTFFVGMREPDSTLRIGTCANNFLPGVTWIDWPTNPLAPWANNEDFGFNAVYVIRPNFNSCGAFAASASSTPSTCGNSTGSATATLAGGSGTITYAWSNGGSTQTISNLAAGIYTVTISSTSGCSSTATVTVANSNGPAVNVANTPVTCNGANNGTAMAMVTGGTSPYTYAWSNGGNTATISNLAPGTYTVTVSDATSCTGIGTVTVTEPAALAANATASNESCQSCNDGSATAAPTGGTAPYTYAWSNGGTTQTINFLAPGTYTVTVTDAQNCTSTQNVTVAPFAVGIANPVDIDIQIFPNPSNGQFSLNVATPSAQSIKVEIFGTLGQLVWTESKTDVMSFNRDFAVNELAAGRYMVKVTVGEKASVRKLVIQ